MVPSPATVSAVISRLALSYSTNLAFVARCNIQGAVRRERQIPDVFALGIEEHRLLAASRNLVHLAVRRRPHEQSALGVERNGLRRQIRRIKHGDRLSKAVEAENLGR